MKVWYFAPTALNGILALGAIPILISAVGLNDWASIALGQSIGLVGSVIISMGWPVIGPALIATSIRIDQERHLAASFVGRLLVAVPVVGLLSLLPIILADLGKPLVVATAISTSVAGLTSSWYYLGLAKPVALFLFDSAARSTCLLLGLVLTAITSDPYYFIGGIIAGNLVASTLPLFLARGRSGGKRRVRERLSRNDLLENGFRGSAVNLSFVLLSSLALPIVGSLSAEVLVVFALYDKLQKQFTTLLLPVLQIIVSRLAMARGVRGVRGIVVSSRRAVLVSGFIATLVCIPVAPGLVKTVSLGTVHMGFAELVLFSAIVGATFVAQAVPVAVLAPLNGLRHATRANLIGLLVMVPLVILGESLLGLVGVLLALAASFVVVVALLDGGLRYQLRSDLV